MSTRLMMLCILSVLSAWLTGGPKPADAADPIIVRENLFSPTREPEASEKAIAAEPQAKVPELLSEGAIVLKGVSIHGERRWAILSVAPRYLPSGEGQQTHEFFKRGRISGGTMGRAVRRNGGASSDHSVVVVGEGERLGEFNLDAVGPDYAILSRKGRQFRLEMYGNTPSDMSDQN